jgi:adenylate cyclase
MADVLGAAERNDSPALEQWFRDKVVLVGTADSSDQQSTPFYLAEGQSLTPGVEIQASSLATLLSGKHLQELPVWQRMMLVLAAAILAAFSIVRLRFPYGPLGLIAAVLCYLVISVVLLSSGAVLPVVPVVMSVVLSGLTSYGTQALTEGRQKRLLQEVFGKYVSAVVASELLEYGEVPLGGTRQPVTIMFTDLRNYTSYCQGRDPHQVVEELNQYFAEMSAEIKKHGGMINKFIGDGIMALFGAPVPHPDDARRAVACGLKMVERNAAFNERRLEQGLEPLVIGIGVHTGNAVVGNIGAPEKMEYTAIGDAVNIASRIESENKTFGTRLLISPTTWNEVSPYFAAEPAGAAKMKGIDEPMTLYKVTGLQ